MASDDQRSPKSVGRNTPASPLRNHVEATINGLRERIATTDGEAQLRLLFGTQAIWETDANGLVVADSSSWRAFTGQTVQEWLGYGWLDAIHPDDRAYAEQQWRETIADLGFINAEFRLRAPDGGWRWTNVRAVPVLDATGEVCKWVGMNTDIDGRKHAEEQLIALNNTLDRQVQERTAERDRLWETSPDLLLIMDFEGYIRRVNPAWTASLGYEPDELVGHHVNDFVLAQHHPETVAAYELAAAGGLPRIENRYRHKDGSTCWIAWVAASAGKMIYATGRDVTKERQQQTELQAAQDALRQSQKMEAVGHLTGGIAHDFNNLLTAVTGGLDLLKVRIEQGRLDQVGRYVDIAQTGARRAAALTQRLLAFSRRQTLAPTAVNPDQLVTGMEDILDRTLGPSIEVIVAGTAGLWPVLVDAPQLENALLNLCINSRDAMPEGGRLTIETANRSLDTRAAAEQELESGDYVSLCVSDTGVGMEPDLINRIFDPFFTTKPLGEGTGLGLSMIYGFTRQSGGQVRVNSEVRKGTTICLFLPRHIGDCDDAVSPAAAEGRRQAEDGDSVLIVEDEIAIRTLVCEILREAGYKVLEASTGSAGVSVLQGGERIDLLITDVGLPGGLNGRQVADAGRIIRPNLKVLFITGYAANAAVGAGQLDDGMTVLTKPFDILDLERQVHAMVKAGRPSETDDAAPADA